MTEGRENMRWFKRGKGMPQFHSLGSYVKTKTLEKRIKLADLENKKDFKPKNGYLPKHWSDGFLPQHRDFYNHFTGERHEYPDEESSCECTVYLEDEKLFQNMAIKIYEYSVKQTEIKNVELPKPPVMPSKSFSRRMVRTQVLCPSSTILKKINARVKPVSMEEYISRKKMMNKLGFHESDYHFLFLRDTMSAFQLIAESYPFTKSNGYITALSHDRDMLIQNKAAENNSLRIEIRDVKKVKTDFILSSAEGGLFSFEYKEDRMHLVQMANYHNWHVLLDISNDKPCDLPCNAFKDYRPDFVISISPMQPQTHFRYRSACLLIKKNLVSHSIPE